MNIGILCYPTYGGSGVVATELGKSLARKGHKIHFITYAMPLRLEKFQDNIFFHEVEIPHYPLFDYQSYDIALAGKIVDVARFERLDIVHAHYAIPHSISAFLANQAIRNVSKRFKVVTTLHGTDITLVGLERSLKPFVRLSIEQSNAVTAVSEYLRKQTYENLSIDTPIDVIPNFIDPNVYSKVPCEKVRNTLGTNCQNVLIHVSNFRPVKRVLDTIYILKKVRETVEARLVLIGDGPDRTKAERLCRELGLENHILFLGKQSALPELLSSANVFLLPSGEESFGLSALEAMSCEVPVVGSNIGGISEVVTHGYNGYLAPLGDIDAMANYVITLLSNKETFNTFSQNARRAAIENFHIDSIVQKYEDVYNRVAAE